MAKTLADVAVGDTVHRYIADRTYFMSLVVTGVTDDQIICADWTFSRRTGAELDSDLAWDEDHTGSYILPDPAPGDLGTIRLCCLLCDRDDADGITMSAAIDAGWRSIKFVGNVPYSNAEDTRWYDHLGFCPTCLVDQDLLSDLRARLDTVRATLNQGDLS